MQTNPTQQQNQSLLIQQSPYIVGATGQGNYALPFVLPFTPTYLQHGLIFAIVGTGVPDCPLITTGANPLNAVGDGASTSRPCLPLEGGVPLVVEGVVCMQFNSDDHRSPLHNAVTNQIVGTGILDGPPITTNPIP